MPFLEAIRPAVRGLDIVTYRVGQRRLHYIAGERRLLGSLGEKAGPHAVHPCVDRARAAQHLRQGHVTHSLFTSMRFRMTRAGADSGTRCCLPAFMRSAGTVQIAAALSISPSLCAPRVTRSSGRENQKLERETANASVLPGACISAGSLP